MHRLSAAWAAITAILSDDSAAGMQSNGASKYALAAGVCLAATFLSFLNHNAYPVARIEVGLSFMVLSLLAIAFGLLCARLKRRERFLVSTLFVVIIIQMNFDGGILLVAATIAAAILLKYSVLSVTSIAFFVVFLFQVAEAMIPAAETAPVAKGPVAEPAPLIVHVLLDGAIGIEGMPKDIPEATTAAEWGQRRLTEKGFAVFGRAYSEHLHTLNAVPEMFGFGMEVEVEKISYQYKLKDNPYMEELTTRGYAITVYQNSVADYCRRSDLAGCWTANGYRVVSRSAYSSYDKAQVLMFSFASLSETFEFFARLYDLAIATWPPLAKIIPPLDWNNGPFPSTLGGMQALEQLLDRAETATDGEAHFAHVLLPHAPYVYNADCALKPLGEWRNRESHFTGRRELYRTYAEQWQCAVHRIAQLVDVLEASRSDRDFIVIVHGDHGSRITPVKPTIDNVGEFSPQLLRDSYSTLVAIRMPGLSPGYRREVISVQNLLRDLAAAEFRGPFTPQESDRPSVFLTRSYGLSPEERFAIPMLFDDE